MRMFLHPGVEVTTNVVRLHVLRRADNLLKCPGRTAGRPNVPLTPKSSATPSGLTVRRGLGPRLGAGGLDSGERLQDYVRVRRSLRDGPGITGRQGDGLALQAQLRPAPNHVSDRLIRPGGLRLR